MAMTIYQARSWWRVIPALLPITTAALAIGVFIVDLATGTDIAVAVLYVAVVLMAARFCRPLGIVLVALGCAGLTVLGYFLSHPGGPEVTDVINRSISIAAIGLTIFFAAQSQSAEAALREQASLLDLTHDSVISRTMDDVITYWNRGAEALYGWQRAEAAGKVAHELLGTSAPMPLGQIRAELLRTGRWEGELVNKRRDGTPIPVASRWSLQRDGHGRPAMILETSNDISESQRVMEALQQSEKQWSEVFEHNPVMYFMVDASGTVLSVNAFGAEHLGYTVAELVEQSVLMVFFEEDREIVKGHVATCLAELGRSHSWEIRKVRKDGTILWIRENAKAVRRPGKDVIVLIACEDITERRRAEQRRDALYAVARILAEAESLAAAAPHLLRAIGANLEWDWGALWSVDRQGAPLCCQCLWHMPDVDTAEFDTVSRERTFPPGQDRLGQVWRSALPLWMVDATSEPEFSRAPAAARAGLRGAVIFPILLDTEALGIVEFFSRAARERDEEQIATLSAIGSQIGQFITRRRAEAGLRASEERWRRLFETSAAGMALLRLDGLFTAANPALQRMLGRTEEEIVGRNVLELNHEDERAATADAFTKYRSGSLTERHVGKKYLRKDGSPVWLNLTTTLVPATETTAPFVQAVYMDITERVRFEAALRASEERWRTIFETAAAGIATLDFEHGRYMTANESFQRMTGYTEDELRNLTPLDITHEDDRAAALELRDDFVINGPRPSYRLEKRYRRKDGTIIWVDVNTFAVPATETTPAFFAAIIVDITDRKRAEEALQQAQADLVRLNRVMLLGEMAASIAHEVNQPIAAVITNANAGLRWLGARRPNLEEVRQALGRIVRDGNRVGEVIDRVRALVRRVPPRRDRLDINQVIREVIALTQAEVQRNAVGLQLRLADGLPPVPGDRVQLQQVMTNLIVNAVEAMSSVSDRPRELTIVSGAGDANDIFVEVQDTGPGLDLKDLDRLFQSFYTTKPEGMGMGLAISRSIVEAHGGRLSAAPNRPHGAAFRFTLLVGEQSPEGPERARC